MKKLIQITLISSGLCAGAYAHVGDLMYIRGDIHGYKFNDVSMEDKTSDFGQYNDPVNIKGGKYTHQYNCGGSGGLGYIIDDKFRAELIYNRLNTDRFKFSDQKTYMKSKMKVNINAFFVRGVYDISDRDIVQFFIGGGVGIANVRHTLAGTTKAAVTVTPAAPGPPPVPAVQNVQDVPYNAKSKNKNNFAFTLMFGASKKITEDLRIEAAYNFTNYGKTSRLNSAGGGGQVPLHAHSISLGIRFDLM